MPPKTAMRFMSYLSHVPFDTRRIRAQGPELPAGVAGLMRDREWLRRLRQRRAKQGIGRFDQDGTHADAAIGDHSAMIAHEQALIVVGHHLWRHALACLVAALAVGLGANAQ